MGIDKICRKNGVRREENSASRRALRIDRVDFIPEQPGITGGLVVYYRAATNKKYTPLALSDIGTRSASPYVSW